MRRPLIVGAIAAAALGLGLLAAPALAAVFSDDTTTVGYGYGRGNNADPVGSGRGGQGNRLNSTNDQDRPCLDTSVTPSGTLTEQQRTALAGMAEEEKLAHDVYLVFAEQTGDSRFTRIASAEEQHLNTMRFLLDRYGIDDPTEGKAAGEFTTAAVQTLYDDLTAEGKTSLAAALTVGQRIERMDIADLQKAAEGLQAADVAAAYSHLEDGSERHLAAFGG